ncbi:response regulator [Idiomarina ramblicola]|uniref:Response regulator n=1 Tax=Idiomarina ramblicola TaxID=263724 RepID=A0A432Z1B6_9GAMM|nr:response regulator [Idiomarina ramblicola]RUO71639.1 response regulator [Idiomarina ramblicola]
MSNRIFKVLVIEDENEVFEHVEGQFRDRCERVEIEHASSRDEAINILKDESSFFDYITLDLKIPVSRTSPVKEPNHGLAVLGEIVRHSPGTPVLILTGTSTVEMIQGFLQQSRQADVWGTGREMGNLGHLTKSKLIELGGIIEQVYTDFSSLINIELSTDGLELPVQDDRLLRIFVNKHHGCLGNVSKIGGGLSNARVYALTIKNDAGVVVHNAVCKCGPRNDIQEDVSNYRSFINRLLPEATPRLLGSQDFGAGSTSGVLYGLAEKFNDSFFSIAYKNELNDSIKQSIRNMLRKWHDNHTQERKEIRQIRQYLLNDETAERLIREFDIKYANEFEKESVHYKESCIHGDFHGENILIDNKNNAATLIDYGDVKVGPMLLDPITLECSFLFHPSSTKTLNWSDVDPENRWTDIESYCAECPVLDSVKFCREWMHQLKIGNREVAACLYSYSLRQLKYPNTNKKIALSLIKAAFKVFEDS